MDDLAERKETKNGRPSRQKRNEKWTTQPKGKKRKWTTQLKGKKRKMDDTAERKETKS